MGLHRSGSRAFFVGKKGTSAKRLVVDYKPLNAYMYPPHWPIPLVQDIFDRLAGALLFTKLDLKSGYYQITNAEESIKYTAFATPIGHFKFVRMPFGLRNEPAEFCKIMHDVLVDLPFVRVYLDDITVFSKTFEEQCRHLLVTLSRLLEHGLRVNFPKCEFLRESISLLGHVIGHNKIWVEQKLVEAIQQRKAPYNLPSLQSFLGLANYYRRYIRGYADIVAPPNRLLKKSVTWEWTDLHQRSFEELKTALSKYPVLRMADFSKPFILCCDASG